MQLLDLRPSKGVYSPGETIQIMAAVHSAQAITAILEVTIAHLTNTLTVLHQPLLLETGEQEIAVSWQPPRQTGRGYGVQACLLDAAGGEHTPLTTAFDVQEHWTDCPRYGFLCDFAPNREDIAETLDALARFHINSLQFYDWQYRHHDLLPPGEEYLDPLGRRLSLATVRLMLDAAHQRGMACMPYLVVYAAGLDFWATHPEWALYGADGQPLKFFDFLGLMDPSPDKGWSRHLLAECGRVLQALPFDGLHVDQYGDPKQGYDAAMQPVDIPAAFAAFVRSLKANYPQTELLFNAVGNWPIESLAAEPLDALYIEIWPPAVRYTDVAEVIQQGRTISSGKPVIIALYQPADHIANIRLADAFILGAGGTRIQLGERARLLADPYFPKHHPLSQELYQALRQWNDFSVRYGEWLGPQAAEATEVQVTSPAAICAFPRRRADWVVLGLVNTTGISDLHWDEPHPAPQPLSNVRLEVRGAPGIQQAWWADPNNPDPTLRPLEIEQVDDHFTVCLPEINYFALLAFSPE